MRTFRISVASVVVGMIASESAHAQWFGDDLQVEKAGLAATSVGELAFFAGGFTGCLDLSGGTFHASDSVSVYNASTDTWSGAYLSEVRSPIGATSVGDYALFAGGVAAGGVSSSVVDVYDAALGAWFSTNLPSAMGPMTATTVGGLALFSDGTVVDIYDSSAGHPTDSGAWTTDQRSVGPVTTSVGIYALFAGYGVLDIYDSSTRTWGSHSLALPVDGAVATTVGDKAMFVDDQTVAIYDHGLGDPTNPSAWSWTAGLGNRHYRAATAVGDRALFSAGLTWVCDDCGAFPVVDIYISPYGQWQSSPGKGKQAATTVAGMAMFAGDVVCNFVPMCCTVSEVDVYQPIGASFCSANPNSTGYTTVMTAGGSTSIADNDFTLMAEPVPDQFFLFFFGLEEQEVPFGNGFLCVGGGLTRILPPELASEGVAERVVDLPSNGITTPGTFHFQCWYRDPGAGGALFNTSDAISVTFVP